MVKLNSMAVVGAALAGASLLTLPTAAHADWSFTKWGMSPGQVIKAANGKVTAAAGVAGDRVMNMDLRAAGGPTPFEGRSYMANFYFDMDGGRGLRVVRLSLVDQSQCDALAADLAKRYGVSSNKHHGEWVDPATGDKIFFSNTYQLMASFPCYMSIARL